MPRVHFMHNEFENCRPVGQKDIVNKLQQSSTSPFNNLFLSDDDYFSRSSFQIYDVLYTMAS